MYKMELLNPKVIEQIIKDTSLDMLDPLLAAFKNELDKHQQQLLGSLEEKNIKQIAEEAHSLKSCSGTFGAQHLYQHSMILEEAAKLAVVNIATLKNDVINTIAAIKATRHCYENYDFSEIKKAINA